MHFSLIAFIVISKFSLGFCVPTTINIDVQSPSRNFEHFWESTGLCPPDPKNETYEFFARNDQKTNLALIGALPNQGIKQVRIHWLFNSIFSGESGLNFTYLDVLMDFLVDHNLQPRFELMGYPTNITNVSVNYFTQQYWRDLVESIATRYIDRFGLNEVSSWKFELWNEPDLANYNVLNFTLSEYLDYVQACSDGLSAAFRGKAKPILIGPAGLFREENHPLCWGLLQSCSRDAHCLIQSISFHRKGDGTALGVLNGTLELLDLLHNKFPHLANVPIANDESDIITTWSDSWEWLGDARYAAMVVKVIVGHYKSVSLDRKLKIELLSNDNGFLNYHPFYFTQRTLFARFQMNQTCPPHDQFIKKPIYTVMALLSMLDDSILQPEIINDDPLLTVLATKASAGNQSNTGILLSYANDQEVNIETIKSVRVDVNNLSIGSRVVVYLLDNVRTNPYKLWTKLGAPVFPSTLIRKLLREKEGPYRLFAPTRIQNETYSISVNLTIPSLVFIHICPKPITIPGIVTKLSIFNITRNEVLLTWSDTGIGTKCIKTYEIEFESKCSNSLEFIRVNSADTIFLSYHHATTGDGACETTIGRYRVRALDYWNQPGNYSEVITYT